MSFAFSTPSAEIKYSKAVFALIYLLQKALFLHIQVGGEASRKIMEGPEFVKIRSIVEQMNRLETTKKEKPKFTSALTHLGDLVKNQLEAVLEEESTELAENPLEAAMSDDLEPVQPVSAFAADRTWDQLSELCQTPGCFLRVDSVSKSQDPYSVKKQLLPVIPFRTSNEDQTPHSKKQAFVFERTPQPPELLK
jgi:hypothetical protein